MRRIFYAFCFLFLFFQAFPAYAQWEPVTIPGDESINQIERSAQYWYGLGDRNLYRSANDGLNWEKIRGGLDYGDRIATQEDTVYLLQANTMLLRSTNGGEQWDTLTGPFNLYTGTPYMAIGGQYLYVHAINKLYRFNKYTPSAEPELIYASGGFINAQARVAASNAEVFLTINDSLLYSNDAGNSWSLLHKGFFARGIAYHADTIVITSTERTHRSANKGQSWESFTQYLGYQNVTYADGMWQTFISGTKILFSFNGGADWQQFIYPEGGNNSFRRKGNLIIRSSNSGVARSVDGGQNWEFQYAGFEKEIGIFEFGPFETGGLLNLNGIFSPDEGISWMRTQGPLGYSYGLPIEFQGNFFHMENNGQIYRAPTVLGNWTLISSQIHASPFGLISTGDNLFMINYIPQTQDSLLILQSKDMGVSWQQTARIARTTSTLNSLVGHQGYLYMITQNSRLVRSIDGGQNWQIAGIIPPGFATFDVQQLLSIHGKLFIIFNDGILVSEDNGFTFKNIALDAWNSLTSYHFAYDGTYLVASNYNKVYLAKEFDKNWIDITENLPSNVPFDEISLTIHKGYIYAKGAYDFSRRKLSPLQTAQLSGEVYQDDNNNGLKDPGEAPLGGIYLKAGNGSYTTTKPDGTFSFNAYLDRDTVQALAPKSWMKVNPEKRFVQGDQSGLQFGIYSPPGIFDFSCVVTNGQVFRSGFQQNVFLNWQHNGTATGNGVLQCVLSAPLQFLSATITPDQIKGDTLIWNLLNIQGKSSGVVTLEVLTPVGTPLGTPVRISAVINPLIGNDAYPSDNQFELYTEVLGAYDPNDKQCEPTHFTLQDLDIPPPLTYTIRFQNEGNFPAEFVRILDTLDYAYLDVATFQVLASSHPCDTRITDKGIVEFYFADIQLPAKSSDEAGSQGFIKYSIQPKRGLPTWVNIRNRAHIFFDFNEAVVTNTTETGVQLPVWVRDVANPDLRLKAWPNPSGGVVLLAVPESSGVLRLFDAYGHLLEQRLVTKTEEQFDLSAYPAGTYRAIWTGDKGDVVRSVLLVKQ